MASRPGEFPLFVSGHMFRVHCGLSLVFDIQVLAEYLVRLGPEFVKGRTVFELGSGTGLVGLVSGALGAEAVWITDQVFVSHTQASFSLGEIMTPNTRYDMQPSSGNNGPQCYSQ